MILDSDDEHTRFAELYEEYHRDVYLVAKNILHHTQFAEDAAQDTWLWIALHFHRVLEIRRDKQRAYITTAARHVALNMKKREQRCVPLENAVERNEKTAHHEEWSDEYNLLVNSILGLPEIYSRILEMKFVLDMSSKEIAKELNMKPSTVDTRISRGRKMLIERMKEVLECQLPTT